MDENSRPSTYSLQETHLRYKDRNKLQVKGVWEKLSYTSETEKRKDGLMGLKMAV